MIDHNSQFFAILTAVGEAKQANADALGIPWTFSQMGVGDANGTDPIPNRTQTALINERRRAPLNQLKIDPDNANIIIAEQIIPEDVGGWWIREIGLYDAAGDLVVVANCAPSYKPLLSQGTGRTQVVRTNLIVSSTANVELKIDPSVVLATRTYVDQKVLEELNKQDFKHSVRVATSGAVPLSGLQSVDGVALAAGDRVLVKNQAAGKENGIYLAATGAWPRAQDADTNLEVTPGLFVHVEKGIAAGDSLWQLVTDAPLNLGSTALVFEMVAGRTGVSAGTYQSVTVDRYGRVMGATGLTAADIPLLDWSKIDSGKPDTLSGYGIGDSYTQTETRAVVSDALIAFSTPEIQVPALINGFVDVNSSRYWKANGNLYVSLDVSRWESQGANMLVMFTLPPGYRPKFRICGVGDWATQSPFGLGWLSWRAETSGEVFLDYPAGSTAGDGGFACQVSFCVQVEEAS